MNVLPRHTARLTALAAASLLLAGPGCGHRSDPAPLGPASGTRPSETGSPSAGLPSSAPPTGQPPITVRAALPGQAPLVGPPVRVDGAPPGVQTAETSIVASPEGELLAAWGDTRLAADGGTWRIGYAVSLDDGDTWHEGLLESPAAAEGPVDFEADPMTAWDPRTGGFWAGGISFTAQPEAFAARKEPGALTFEPAVRIRADGLFVDKGFLAAGPAPDDPAATLLHFIDRRGLQTSRDLGATWGELLFQGNLQGPLPRVGPGGELYVAFWNGLDGVQLLRSFDGGATLEDRSFIARRRDLWDNTDGSRFPGRFRVPPLPYLTVDPVDGTLYCLYFDTARVVDGEADVDLFFTRSDDRGDSWTPARPIPFGAGDPDRLRTGDQFFPWLEVDPLGRLHLVFYDTREVEQHDDQESAHVDVTYAWSEDRGESWSELRLTEEPFETGDALWTVPPGQFLGDYLGLAVAGDRAHPLYPVARDGDLDLWTRRIDFRSPQTPVDPPPPQALAATPLSPTEIRLDWLATGPGTVPGTSVLIEIHDLLGGTVRRLTPAFGSAELVLGELEPGRPYAFRAATRTAAGISAWSEEVFAIPMETGDAACQPPGGSAPDTLCLLDDRFRIKVAWRDPFNGGHGTGHPAPFALPAGAVSRNTGTFWFFDPENVELVLKVLDGGPVNGAFWVFYGSLTQVEYWVTVFDGQRGVSRTYHNPPRSQCGLADTRAFPNPAVASLAADPRASVPVIPPLPEPSADTSGFPCKPGETELCLAHGRFRLEVSWRDPRTGAGGKGRAIPGTDDSGFFWFFDPENVELVVKILDGRKVNARYWFFSGGLSDLEVTITATDTLLGRPTRVYRKPAFDLCGLADIRAF